MEILKYLDKYQHNIYKLLVNNITNSRFSHAYLINGNFNTPLLDVSFFIAKCILCSNKDINDTICPTCQKIISKKYDDLLSLIVIDGNKETIGKEDVLKIEDRFTKTSIEKNLNFVYIINCVENMTKEAINALLKYLEEPNENVYAILTTKNVNQVLPTIVSRCQNLKIISENKNEILSNFNIKDVPLKYGEILINFSLEESEILTLYSDKTIKSIIDNTLNYLNNIDNKYKRHFIIETDIIPLLNKDFYSRFAIDLLTLFLSQSINYKKLNDTQLKSYENTLDKIYNNISNIEDVTLKIYKLRKTINIHINVTLLFEHIDFLFNEVSK